MKSLAMVLLVGLIGCSPMVYVHGIPNLDQVSDRLYRGGQPTSEGWKYLKSIGVQRVVKFNYEREGSDDEARKLGMEVIEVPMPPSELADTLGQPSTAEALRAVSALSGDVKTYGHCTHGQDRTGLIFGLYRILHDRWTKAKAWTEMLDHHFHWELLGLVDFWREFKTE